MKYLAFASFLLIVATVMVHGNDDYIPKTRPQVATSFRTCLTKLEISQETFRKTNWDINTDNELVKSMIKCMTTDFGLFDEATGFSMDRLVKQFDGETVRTRVEKCVDNNPNGDITDVRVHRVMYCFEKDGLKLYR